MYTLINEIEVMNCIKCNQKIPPKRIEILPGTKTCVNCSTASPKRGVPIMRGSGDHTWVDLEIMTQDQFEKYKKLDQEQKKNKE
jgi:RNA polymerase-binding transcription factor DksA|tara:strand:+ start:283 stop:534 length:252 start_codon:yes stop_codon:yes gene_type:complete